MAQQPPEIIYGRHVPSGVAKQGLRQTLRHKAFKFGAVLAAGLSLAASSTPEPDPPVDPDVYSEQTHKRINAERTHMEQAFVREGLNIIDFEFMDATTLNPTAYKQRTRGNGLQPYYRLENINNTYQTVLAGYEEVGAFNLDLKQRARSDAYVPTSTTYPAEATTLTQRAAYHAATEIAADLKSGSLGKARLVMLDRPHHHKAGRACAVVVMSEQFDSDMFVAEFSRVDSVISRQVHDVADFNQAITNHEYGHCVFSAKGDATWKNESRADLYAIARHIQLNGDDGFAEVWRDLRNMNVIGARSSSHDTIPLLDRAIPTLLKAHAEGKLEGLSPEQLMKFTLTKTARGQGQTQQQMWDSLELQVHDREEAFKDMQGTISRIGPTMHLDRQGLATKDLSTTEVRGIQRVIGSFNQSLERQFVLQCLVARHENGQENPIFARYRENLERYIPTQPTAQQAYENLGYRLWQLDDAQTRNAKRFNPQTAAFIEATNRDATGLTSAEKRTILEEMRAELAQRPDVTPEVEPAQEVERSV